jgi:hypothetical protein
VSSVVSDLLGTSARRMLQALADGETFRPPLRRSRPRVCAQMCDAFSAGPTRHPIYRRLLPLTLEELRLIEERLG